MADPMSLSVQYQNRLDASSKYLDQLPNAVMQGMKIPGIRAQNRILIAEAKEAEGSLSVSEQLRKTVQDPHGIMGEFGDLKTAKDMRLFMAKHAAIAVSPIGKNLLGIFDKIASATESAELNSIERIGQLAEAKAAAEFNFEMLQSGYNPKNPDHVALFNRGKVISRIRKQANDEKRIFNSSLLPPDLFTDSGFADPLKENQAIDAMPRIGGDFTAKAAALNLEPSGLDAQGNPTFARPRQDTTTETIIDPKTGIVTTRQIRGGSKSSQSGDALTTANVTKMQESLQQSINTIDVANRLEPLLSNETVGALAFAENIVFDKVLSQAFPELASKDRAEATVLAARLRSSAIATLKSDGNITEKERAQILQAVPEVNDPLDSPQNALNVIRATRRMEALSALTKAQKLGANLPMPAVQALSVDDLINATKAGVITEQTATSAFRMRPKSE